MEILLSAESFPDFEEKYAQLVSNAATEAVKYDGYTGNGEISISIVTGDEIKELNKKYRGKDSVTDVLSFPLLDITQLSNWVNGNNPIPLGDVVICFDKASDQALEYGHSLERELAFLTVHGTLHLLGYDHIEESDEVAMISAQKCVMEKLGIRGE